MAKHLQVTRSSAGRSVLQVALIHWPLYQQCPLPFPQSAVPSDAAFWPTAELATQRLIWLLQQQVTRLKDVSHLSKLVWEIERDYSQQAWSLRHSLVGCSGGQIHALLLRSSVLVAYSQPHAACWEPSSSLLVL